MKTRSDFVTNSSSSSFIVTIGEIKDVAKFSEWCKENNVNYDRYIFTGIQILNWVSQEGHYWEIQEALEGADWAGVDINKTEILTKIFKNMDGAFLLKSGSGPGDDSWFQSENDYDCDYDKIKLDDFSKEDTILWNISTGGSCLTCGQKIREPLDTGLEIFCQEFGAGRDG